MCLLLVNLYEIGQFLRIFLWVSLPMMTLLLLLTTYIHYRSKRAQPAGPLLSVAGFNIQSNSLSSEYAGPDSPSVETVGEKASTEDVRDQSWSEDKNPDEAHQENLYRGILWMKEKYEKYRDLADKRYDQLRDELDQTEKKYQELLAGRIADPGSIPAVAEFHPISDIPAADHKEFTEDMVEEKNRQIQFLQSQLDQRIKTYHLLEQQGRQDRAKLEESEGFLQLERDKVVELVAKLQHNSLLLMSIYKELDKSLNLEKQAGQPQV